MSDQKRDKIFVGFASFIGWDTVACILFPESNTPATGHSIAGVAHQQVDALGKNWTSKISFSSPTEEVLTNGDGKKFKLVEFNTKSIATFTEAMVRALATKAIAEGTCPVDEEKCSDDCDPCIGIGLQ